MKKYLFTFFFLLITFPVWATTRYVCNNITTCNANGGSGWSGTPGTLSGCGSKTNPCNTLNLGMLSMSSGDTLVVGNGTYTSSSADKVTYTNHPAAGPGTGSGDARFSIVKAEVSGYVTIGNGTYDIFDSPTGYGFNGNSYGNGAIHKWIKWEGLIFKSNYSGFQINNGEASDFTTGDLAAKHQLYWYFKGCGFNETDGSETGTINISYSSYIIFEDCFSWGRGRYGINTYLNDYLVFRRHIDRRDAVQITSSYPVANYMNYCSHKTEWQNIIALDTDADYWSTGTGYLGAFGVFYNRESYNSRRSEDVAIRGLMGVNIDTTSAPTVDFAGIVTKVDPLRFTISNSILWKTGQGIFVYDNGSATVDHVTVGMDDYISYYDTSFGDLSGVVVTNSNAYNLDGLSIGTISNSSAYNNDYNSGGSFAGSNVTTSNTAYKYIFKPEASFPDGNDSQKKGAKVLYKYGVDGTFYGETGYATYQDETAANKLWPWGKVYTGNNSWEKLIWSLMRANYDSSDETRGFAQSNQSITNWVATGAGTITPTNALTVDGAGGTSLANVDTYIYEESGVSPATVTGLTISGGVSIR